jgi:hypothetical protein
MAWQFLYSSRLGSKMIKYVAASRMKTPLKYSCRGSNKMVTTTKICKGTVTNPTYK